MLTDCIWTVLLLFGLFQFLSDADRLAHHPLAFLFPLLCCYFHLVAATDGVLVIDDELQTLVALKTVSRVTDKRPNYFLIPPKFAFSLKLNFLDFPRLAFYLRSFCVNLPKSLRFYKLFS